MQKIRRLPQQRESGVLKESPIAAWTDSGNPNQQAVAELRIVSAGLAAF